MVVNVPDFISTFLDVPINVILVNFCLMRGLGGDTLPGEILFPHMYLRIIHHPTRRQPPPWPTWIHVYRPCPQPGRIPDVFVSNVILGNWAKWLEHDFNQYSSSNKLYFPKTSIFILEINYIFQKQKYLTQK